MQMEDCEVGKESNREFESKKYPTLKASNHTGAPMGQAQGPSLGAILYTGSDHLAPRGKATLHTDILWMDAWRH